MSDDHKYCPMPNCELRVGESYFVSHMNGKHKTIAPLLDLKQNMMDIFKEINDYFTKNKFDDVKKVTTVNTTVKKHITPLESPTTVPAEDLYSCSTCNSVFTTRRGMNKHVLHHCSQNKTTTINNMVDNLIKCCGGKDDIKMAVVRLNQRLSEIEIDGDSKLTPLSTLAKQDINHNSNQFNNNATNNQVNSNNICNNNNININLNNIGNETFNITESKIWNGLITNALESNDMKDVLVKLFSDIHCNQDRPENHNVFVSNKKTSEPINAYIDQEWKICAYNTVFDQITSKVIEHLNESMRTLHDEGHLNQTNYRLIQDKIRKNVDPQMKSWIRSLKKECFTEAYNKRKILKNTYRITNEL